MTTLTPLKNAAFRDPRLAPLLREAAARDLTSTTVPSPKPSTTPARLRRAQVVTMVVLLLLGAVAAVQQFDLRAQLGATPQLAGQYDRLATIEADLIEARNLASLQALGVAGVDPTTALNDASAQLVTAAAQRPTDQDGLATVSQATLTYAGLLQTPSAARLAKADELLTGTIQPTLQKLRAALQTETGQRSWSFSPVLLWLTVVAAAVGLLVVSVELAQRTRRTFNLGLVLAVVAAVTSAWLGLAGLNQADAADQANRTGTFDQVVTLTNGRLTLADLRRQLTGAALAHNASAEARAAITARLNDLSANTELPYPSRSTVIDAYTAALGAVEKGDWATVTNDVAKAAEADNIFTSKLSQTTASTITAGVNTTQAALNALLGQAIAALAFALAGAGVGYWGISRRLREYR
ncbi:MAG: hypothetical protein CVT62_01815 [Actinobacteria bacterium HGW-Actinobacteria-2]|nr:MAG: hypothetical protein CVT62_01815 [Actinobacteria bacterium HGW-Actinobacteria-2]